MAQPRPSTPPAQEHSQIGRGQPPASTSDTASILSAGDYSDTYDSYYQDRDRDKASRTPNTTRAKGKRSMPSPRSASLAPTTIGRASKFKTRASASRAPSLDSEGEPDDADTRGRGGNRERAMSPGLPLFAARGASVVFDEDDEVLRRDRGEELVRKRMRDRARLKKELEKATRKRDQENRLSRDPQVPLPSRRTSYQPGGPPLSDTDDTFGQHDRSVSVTYPQPLDRTPLVRRSTAEPGGSENRSRDVSRLGVRDVSNQGYFSQDEDSVAGTERGFGTSSIPGSPLPQSGGFFAPMSPALGGTSVLSEMGRTSAPLLETREEHSMRVGDEGSVGDRAYDDAGVDLSAGDDDDDVDEDDDEDDPDAEVEYTLKDRQDAINIEHPFGLPIWKPALYKKSRSVTRNAETALHAQPSSYALQHLAPGNLLWTLVFGSWLWVVCTLVSGVLWCTPWGGGKYGRVFWELGGYLFWPFGKYVEGWSDTVEGEEDTGYGDIEEEDEEDQETESGRPDDVEHAGTTYGRGRARLSSGRVGSYAATLKAGGRAEVSGGGSHDSGTLADASTEQSMLLSGRRQAAGYGTSTEDKANRSSSESTIAPTATAGASTLHDFNKDDSGAHSLRVRALGRTMYWVGFYLVVAPLMLAVCVLCWGMVFTVPMAKLLWVLLRHLANEPLSLHFRSPPKYSPPTGDDAKDSNPTIDGIQYPLVAGQRAPPVSKKTVAAAKAQGRIFGPRSTVLLCTYQAAGLQYYKYTVDGVNILFINLLSLVFFVIADDWFIAPYVELHHSKGLLGFLAGKAFIFVIALLSVIPLSYFIGMAVASISAQSSIGMGAVINASFGSIIEIILYCIALTQGKSELVEGSIVGSILAAVLLMPGLSMIGGAMRRKEQRFNAKSAGVTSTMLIMAIIGILTPTLFYEIYGSFQLTCTGCDPTRKGSTTSSCKSCYYEHVDPVDDPFYKNTVKYLSYYCAIILVLSYLVGLWFSLRTHASQIWQNAQPAHELPGHARPLTVHLAHDVRAPNAGGTIKRTGTSATPGLKRSSTPRGASASHGHNKSSTSEFAAALPTGPPAEEFVHPHSHPNPHQRSVSLAPTLARSSSHVRDLTGGSGKREKEKEMEDDDAAGGHDAPNWSRVKSASVLMGCTVLYAIIAEILVDVVDVVLDGSGIPEKLLGVTLFALVPNTTEFMNAISFAINGNIALSMEIGSAYALQVCLIQAPAMLAFSAFYSIGKISMEHRAFTLVFPRWDVIAIIFSVFLLTYTYIEARANYYRGTILCLSYMVLLGGFVFAPAGRDTEDNPIFNLNAYAGVPVLEGWAYCDAVFRSIFSR